MTTVIFRQTIGKLKFEITSHEQKFWLHSNLSTNPILSDTNYGYVKMWLRGYDEGFERGTESQ